MPASRAPLPQSIPVPSAPTVTIRPVLRTESAEPTADAWRYTIAIADSENAVAPVDDTLRYAGVLKKSGKLKRRCIQGLEIVHTGDMLLKHAPDPDVADYWLALGEQIGELGGELILLAGNHELEIWDGLQRGHRLGMKRRQCQHVKAFIRQCRLFHISGSTLFIHGYPTLNLLRRLRDFRERTGLDAADYNDQCFQPALDDLDELAHYRYLSGKGCRKLLLHDLCSPARYYRTHGKEVAALLRQLGIEQLVHGHRPIRSGIQADYEFRRHMPGIRMIGNDTQLRERGLGAVILRQDIAGENKAEVAMVNTKTASDEQRKRVKQMLSATTAAKPRLAAVAARIDPRSEPAVRAA